VIAVGVDVGGTKIAVVRMAGDHSWSASETLPTPKDGEALLDRVAEAVDRCLADTGDDEVLGVGIGLPSQIERPAGNVRGSTNVDLAGVSILDEMARRMPHRVVVDNDGNVSALAEHRLGAGRGTSHLVMLTIGTGVGAGVVIDGALQHGGGGWGMELGHMVVQADGPRCQRNCPNHGCLETMVSGTAIERDAGVESLEVVRRAAAGDTDALGVLERAGTFLGVGLANLANIFSPQVFVIGGGVGLAGGLITPAAEREYAARVLPANAGIPIVPAELGSDAGAVGAALLAWEELGGG